MNYRSIISEGTSYSIVMTQFMPEAIGDRESAVIRACPMLETFEFPIWLVSHRKLRTSRRVRIVYDMLAEMLQ